MPSAPASDADGYRRYLIAVGENCDELTGVPAEIDQLAALLTGHEYGFERVLLDADRADLDLRWYELHERLSGWLNSPQRTSADVLVLYHSGHGEVVADEHYLLDPQSDPHNLAGTALASRQLVRFLAQSPVQHVLVILDTCYGGHGTGEMAAVAQKVVGARLLDEAAGAGLWFVAAARPKDETQQSVFVEAFADAVRALSAGNRPSHLDPAELVGLVNQAFEQRGRAQRARLYVGEASGASVFIPNPGHKPDLPEDVDVEAAEHWDPRARGVAHTLEPGWHFTGRERALRELVGWLTEPDGDRRARVVTSRAGSGKSAVLARLVTLSDPDYRARVPLDGVPADTIPPPGLIDVPLHLRRETLADVCALLAQATGCPQTKPAALVSELLGRPGRLVIVADALDEATQPEAVVDELLRPLAEGGARDVRLLVATRPELKHALDPAAVIIDLDKPRYIDVDDIAAYVTSLLLATETSPYRGQPRLARTVARGVAAKAYPTFLIARLVARSLVAVREPVDVGMPGWDRFPQTVGQALNRDLGERYGRADLARVRDLLLPLAYAEGAGLPRQLWPLLANALTEGHYTQGDIGWLLEHAGAYLVEAVEDGRSLYRLYHEALADHLRAGFDNVDMQRRIVDALLARVPTLPGGARDWLDPAVPAYTRTHLAAHAAVARRLSQLIAEPGYLVAADPTRLVPALADAERDEDWPAEVTRACDVYRRASHLLVDATIGQRVAYLELVARQVGDDRLADRLRGLDTPQPWQTLWARWQPPSTHRIIGRHNDVVWDVALGVLDGRAVAVSSGQDGTVRVWDLGAGGPVGEPLTGHSGWGVRPIRFGVVGGPTVAVGEVDGRAVAVSGGKDGTVRVWDLAAGTLLARIELDAEVEAVACTGSIVVAATERGLVALRLTSLPAVR